MSGSVFHIEYSDNGCQFSSLYFNYGIYFFVCQFVLFLAYAIGRTVKEALLWRVGGLAIPGAFGVYTGLITRVRELIWIVIGVLLMKVGNGTPANK